MMKISNLLITSALVSSLFLSQDVSAMNDNTEENKTPNIQQIPVLQVIEQEVTNVQPVFQLIEEQNTTTGQTNNLSPQISTNDFIKNFSNLSKNHSKEDLEKMADLIISNPNSNPKIKDLGKDLLISLLEGVLRKFNDLSEEEKQKTVTNFVQSEGENTSNGEKEKVMTNNSLNEQQENLLQALTSSMLTTKEGSSFFQYFNPLNLFNYLWWGKK